MGATAERGDEGGRGREMGWALKRGDWTGWHWLVATAPEGEWREVILRPQRARLSLDPGLNRWIRTSGRRI